MPELRTVNAAAVAFLLMLVLFLTVYFGGYFALSVKHSGATANDWCRIFPTPWLTTLYKPAAQVESALTGDEVCTYYQPPSP